jgi:branched-chain amino acid transport system substrate-binding protein
VSFIAGGFLSNIGVALADFAKQKKIVYLASEPLTDKIVWQGGNHYTFRLRPSTFMQVSMLVPEAAQAKKKRWAMVYPNYEYGQSAVATFKAQLQAKQPDVEFVGDQATPLGKIDAGPVAQALADAKPDAIFVVLFGTDLAKFVREGETRGLFKDRTMIGLLTGEPEYIDPLKDEAPVGWYVTGYPWYAINTPEHNKFLDAYQAKYKDYPRLGSVVGYSTVMAAVAALKKAGDTDTEKLVSSFEGLEFGTPLGNVKFRPQDHQSTMGAYVGKTALKDGKGIMVDFHFVDGADVQPSDADVKKWRPQD